MAAPNGFISKKSRKNDQNFTNFFFQKIEHKTSLETQFHQKRTKIHDFSSITARHEKSTAPQNGLYSSLNFRIFEFFQRALTFWDSLHKSFRELPGSQFGPTFDITTALCNNSILDLNTALERILSVLLSCNKSLLPSFTSIAVICSQGPLKCCFYLKILISSNSTFTAKIRMKKVFPETDTIFFWRPETF